MKAGIHKKNSISMGAEKANDVSLRTMQVGSTNEVSLGCCILAGGKSSRMGQDKALLEYEGKKFIEKLCEEMDFFPEKYIARGNRPDCGIKGWKVIPDIYTDRGPMGGIHAVLSSCNTDAVFFATCDMPFLTGNLAKRICQSLRENADAAIAVTTDERVHPLCGIYRKSILDIFEQQLQAGNYRLMDVLDKMQVCYIPLDQEESLQLRNINTQEEYRDMNAPN